MRAPLGLWIILAMGGCEGATDSDMPPVDNFTPVCDGRKQDGEEVTDGPFDMDGDSFYDGSDPGCVATYQATQLDCDDTNPDVNPGAFEILCNGFDEDCQDSTPDDPDGDNDGYGVCEDCNDVAPGVYPGAEDVCFDRQDNDCNGVVDDGCGRDVNGTWTLDVPAVFECEDNFFGSVYPVVTMDMTEMFGLLLNGTLTMGDASNSSPEPVVGPAPGADGIVNLVGIQDDDCSIRWTLNGTFVDDDRLEANLVMDVFGGFGCGNCPQAPQTFNVNATRTAN